MYWIQWMWREEGRTALRFNKMIALCMRKREAKKLSRDKIIAEKDDGVAARKTEKGLWFTLCIKIHWFRLNVRYGIIRNLL